MKIKKTALLMSLVAVGSLSWSASAATITGTDLIGLTYHYPPDAQYVAPAGATPALAALSTPDSGLSSDAPAAFVRAGVFTGLPSLGTLSGLSASYHLYSSSGGNGNLPYWLTYLYAPGGGYVGVISMGGPTLDGSSQIHVIYISGATSSLPYWNDTLSQLDGTAYGTTTFGQLGVYETGVAIGDWNISDSIGATANIDSITVNIPDVASSAWLLGVGFLTLAVFGFRQNRLQLAR